MRRALRARCYDISDLAARDQQHARRYEVVVRNIQANRSCALELYESLTQANEIADLGLQQPFDQPKLMITVERTKAQQAGLSQRAVAGNLLITLSGSLQKSPWFW